MTFGELPFRNPIVSHSCTELEEALNRTGYKLSVIRLGSGQFEATYEIRRTVTGVMIFHIHSTVAIRLLGLRNKQVTAFAYGQGHPQWRTQGYTENDIGGFNLDETQTNFTVPAHNRVTAVLLPRQQLLSTCSQRSTALRTLETVNSMRCDKAELEAWHEVVRHHWNNPDCGSCSHTHIYEPTAALLEHSSPLPQPTEPEGTVRVINCLPDFMERIKRGEDLSVAQMATELDLSLTHLKTVMLDLTGLKPKDFLNRARTEIVISLLNDPDRCQSYGLRHSLVSTACFVGWSEATARRNLKKLLEELPSESLLKTA